MWQNWTAGLAGVIDIVSTWHSLGLPENDELVAPALCRSHWNVNYSQIARAQHLLVFADEYDKPNGTLVEIGMALATGKPVHLVGTFPFGSWRHLKLCHRHNTLHDALLDITGAEPIGPTMPAPKGVPTNDPA
jgi:hypothetical protein